ncbi:MAG: TMEM165/GDT1 family protein [Proteobacteria bacterium]|nr:TMEM165/GDT1 family protein [Pseudomonadota bacterium]
MESFLTSFLMVFTAEMGDKTQFLVFSLSLKYGGLPVFLGASLAFAILNGPGVYIGSMVSNVLSESLVGITSGAVFLVYGIYMFLVNSKEDGENTKSGKNGFLISFTTIFLGELGDKTQVCSLVLGAKFKSFGMVFSGCFLALILATFVGVFLGSRVQKWLPKVPFKKIAGIIMILTGAVIILRTFI